MKGLLCGVVNVYLLILFATAILSWLPSRNPTLLQVKSVLFRLTEPVVGSIRRAMPFLRAGGIDFSFIVLMFGLRLLQQNVLCR